MSKISLLDAPADVGAEPGTDVWARGVVRKIQFGAQRLDTDVRSLQDWIEIATKHEAWRPLGYISLDLMLIKEAKLTQGIIDGIRSAKSGTVGDVIAAAKQNPLADVGPPTKEEKANVCVTNNTKGGTVDYTLRRLARDCPEMLDRIESGELSVNQAAIAAGIRKKPSQAEICVKAFRKAENRLEALQLITSELEPHELEMHVQSMLAANKKSPTSNH